ncbi:MAG: UDP-N-acetylmuramoyl-L-alanyl-D-glutamate--2,6-diaminopimelate ligase, partial [Actinomycetota bacterium]|nr:UDP-N-acetylmuramoyl-L-alanyl-D-glutamate--2,6-diaminopimelate ligase [Actinomycetota bacterium]
MDTGVVLDDLARALGDALVERRGHMDVTISDVTYDSRAVTPDALFIAIPGMVSDGHEFAAAAVSARAAALVVERPLDLDVPLLVVADARRAAATVAATFFGRPADDLLLLGATGTNGKTTTTFLLDSILRAAGHTTGLIGTVATSIAGQVRPGVRTTPESVDLQRLFAEMRAAGVSAVAMEVTSHALVLGRVEEMVLAAAGFTNLSQDHLDFHASMDDYFAAKSALFVPERARKGAVNIDDPYGQKLIANASIPCIGFGTSTEAEVRCEDVSLGASKSAFRLITPDGSVDVATNLVGHFNISNCLAAAAIALQADIALDAVVSGLQDAPSVPGRFEAVDRGQPFTVLVDYAHTPDSLDNVLRAARPLADARGGRVLVAFGCGGDRDRGKRPLMGGVAARRADVVAVTSDNPRSEDPDAIIGEILSGVTS